MSSCSGALSKEDNLHIRAEAEAVNVNPCAIDRVSDGRGQLQRLEAYIAGRLAMHRNVTYRLAQVATCSIKL